MVPLITAIVQNGTRWLSQQRNQGEMGRSGMVVIKGQQRDVEQGVDICDNEFRPYGSSVPTDGDQILISHALKKSETAAKLETCGTD